LLKSNPESARSDVLAHLARLLLAIDQPHPRRVAIDGIDAAGKTTLANELAAVLRASGRTVIRASIDDFHNPRSFRYRLGSESSQGYFSDAYDYATLNQVLLQPLGPAGNCCYSTAVFDLQSDQPVHRSEHTAAPQDILLFDGVFLQRPELSAAWDFTIYVDVTFEIALQRALLRDVPRIGSQQIVLDRYQRRYLPAQLHYLQCCSPKQRADVVIDNNDPNQPVLHLQSPSY
jgi:uridine kinase